MWDQTRASGGLAGSGHVPRLLWVEGVAGWGDEAQDLLVHTLSCLV